MKMADAGFLPIEKPSSTARVSMLTTWTLPPNAGLRGMHPFWEVPGA